MDEIHEVIPMTEDNGVWHPQEGVFSGHFQPNEAQKVRRIGNLRQGVSQAVEDPAISPDVSRKLRVADLITGYGVSESVRHFYDLHGGNVAGKKVLVQGWGNVGAAAALYLAQAGANIVGIIDRAGGLIRPEGLTYEEVKGLFWPKRAMRSKQKDFSRLKRSTRPFGTCPRTCFCPARQVVWSHKTRLSAWRTPVSSHCVWRQCAFCGYGKFSTVPLPSCGRTDGRDS